MSISERRVFAALQQQEVCENKINGSHCDGDVNNTLWWDGLLTAAQQSLCCGEWMRRRCISLTDQREHKSTSRARWGCFFMLFLCLFFKCDWGMQVLILMDCMIVVFRLSDCNAPLHAETLEFGRKSGALQYIPQWIWAIVWEKSVASTVISFIHYYETSRLQQWSRHHRQSGPVQSASVRRHTWLHWSWTLQERTDWCSASARGNFKRSRHY